jgi:hypothetical protein
MKSWLISLAVLLSGCGNVWLTPNGHRLFYKSQNGQLSCYTNSCCFPYKEKLMVCTVADDVSSGSVIVKFIPDK